jgi:polyisoprenoid-binding protein YceI
MKLRILAASAAILVSGATALQAVAQSVSTNDPKAVKAGTYKVDAYHTQIVFSISHFGFTDFYGFFSGASGTLVLNPAQPSESKLDVSIPAQSLLTAVPVLDTQLKGDQWFDAAKFPNATFTSTKVTPSGSEDAVIVGDLTLHGVTKPVTLKAHLVGSGTNPIDKSFTAGFEATGKIRRSDFGIKQYLPLVGDEVSLRIAGAFELQQ